MKENRNKKLIELMSSLVENEEFSYKRSFRKNEKSFGSLCKWWISVLAMSSIMFNISRML